MERLFRMFTTATYSSFTLLRGLVQSRLSQPHGGAQRMFELGYSTDYRGLQQISRAYRREVDRSVSSNGEKSASTEIPKPLPHPPKPSRFPRWARWVVGSILTLLIPLWKLQWNRLQQIEGTAEEVIGDAEIVAEAVETVATVAEKYSAEVAEKLPDDSKLKEAALFVEHVSEVTAQDAHLTDDFIHKVDEVIQKVEKAVETGIQNIVDPPSKDK